MNSNIKPLNVEAFDIKKIANLNLIFANEASDVTSFFNYIKQSEEFSNIFIIKNKTFLSSKSIFETSILEYVNYNKYILEISDVEGIFKSNEFDSINRRLSSHLNSLFSNEEGIEFKLDYSIKFKNDKQLLNMNPAFKRLLLIKVLNNSLKHHSLEEKILIIFDDVDFLNHSKIDQDFFEEIKILSKYPNVNVIVNFTSSRTLHFFSDYLSTSYVLYRNFDNNISLKSFIGNKTIEEFNNNFLIKNQQDHYNRLKFTFSTYEIDFFSKREIIFVFDKYLKYIINEQLGKNQKVYVIDDIKDLIYLATIFVELRQTYKLKIILKQEHKNSKDFNLLTNYLSSNKIDWTFVELQNNLDSITFDSKNESFSQKEYSTFEKINAFIENRNVRILYQEDKVEILPKSKEEPTSQDLSEIESNLEEQVQHETSLQDNIESFNEINNIEASNNSNSLKPSNDIDNAEASNDISNKQYSINIDNVLEIDQDKSKIQNDEETNLKQIVEEVTKKLNPNEMQVINYLNSTNLLPTILDERWTKISQEFDTNSMSKEELGEIILNLLKEIASVKIIPKQNHNSNKIKSKSSNKKNKKKSWKH